jgi:hypothetical protein
MYLIEGLPLFHLFPQLLLILPSGANFHFTTLNGATTLSLTTAYTMTLYIIADIWLVIKKVLCSVTV